MRRQPNEQDIAAATAFHDDCFSVGRDPEHVAFHRADNIRHFAMAEMQRREAAEFRAAVEASRQHDRTCLADVAALPALRADLGQVLA